jgi:hypothetical protein
VLIQASGALLILRSRSAGSRTSALTWYFLQSVCNDLRHPSQNETYASRICQQGRPPVGLAHDTNRWTNWQLTPNLTQPITPDLMLAPAPPKPNRGDAKAGGPENRAGIHGQDRASRWIRRQKRAGWAAWGIWVVCFKRCRPYRFFASRTVVSKGSIVEAGYGLPKKTFGCFHRPRSFRERRVPYRQFDSRPLATPSL